MEQMTPRVNPWVGPLPYKEEDWRSFFGRTKEVAYVLQRVHAQRLSLLTGSSGVGKTSLLRAGVVPALRHERAMSMEDPRYTASPPALVLRDWAQAYGATSIHQVLIARTWDAVQNLGRVAKLYEYDERKERTPGHDFQVLSEVDRPDPDALFHEYASALCDRLGGLFLVFDQFEELLGSSRRDTLRRSRAQTVTRLVGQLFHRESRVRLLVALREEFFMLLHGLEAEVGGLQGRVYRLEPMSCDAAVEAVEGIARVGGVTIEQDVVNRLLEWLREAESDDEQADRQAGEKSEAVDLLALQSLLRELYRQSAAARPGAAVIIGPETLAQYRKLSDAANSAEVVDFALESQMVRGLEGEKGVHEGQRVEKLSPYSMIGMPVNRKLALLQRILALMAPFLSSGGVKTTQYAWDLIHKALAEDFESLGFDAADVGRTLQAAPWRDTSPAADHVRQMAFARESSSGREGLSGYALEYGLQHDISPLTVAQELILAAYDVLGRLSGSILKAVSSAGEPLAYELNHDRLQFPLDTWAKKFRQSLDYFKASLSAIRGANIRPSTPPAAGIEIDYVKWNGCSIGPGSGSDRLLLEEIRFQGCDLRGCLFDGCDFHEVKFKECRLDGVIFRDCTFREVVISMSPPDRRINAMVFEGGTLRDTIFEGCELNQLSIVPHRRSVEGRAEPAAIAGHVRFPRCTLRLADISELAYDSTQGNPCLDFGECEEDPDAPSYIADLACDYVVKPLPNRVGARPASA